MTRRTPRRSVVVTGAAAGIGLAISRYLAEAGWAVVGLDVNAQGLREAADAVFAAGVDGEVSDETVMARARLVAEQEGTLSAWVNNAGINHRVPLHEANLADIDRIIAVNLRGTLIGCREAVRSFLRSSTPGSIVNISSIHARAGFPGTPTYAATKGAIESLTRNVAVEYGPVGIRCNAVAPGAVLTDEVRAFIRGSRSPEEAEEETRLLAAQERIGDPSEIAAVVAWLLGPDASYVTGQVVAVDGGASARVFRYPSRWRPTADV